MFTTLNFPAITGKTQEERGGGSRVFTASRFVHRDSQRERCQEAALLREDQQLAAKGQSRDPMAFRGLAVQHMLGPLGLVCAQVKTIERRMPRHDSDGSMESLTS